MHLRMSMGSWSAGAFGGVDGWLVEKEGGGGFGLASST